MGREYTIQYLCVASAVIFASILGLMIHTFIAAVNITDWMKGRPMTTINQILLYLGFSRMAYQCSFLIDVFFAVAFASNVSILEDKVFLHFLYESSNSCNLWLSSLLSVVFCMKISNFHNVLFVRVKTFILRKVVLLIVFLVLYSLTFAVFQTWRQHSIKIDSPLDSLRNISHNNRLTTTMRVFYIIGNGLPFFFNCVPTIVVLVSLCLHLNRMKRTRNLTVHLDTYYVAIKAIISCFLSFAFQTITNILLLNYTVRIDCLCLGIIFYFFPALHSVYLICIITKLRNQFFRIIHCTTTCLSSRRTKNQIKTITQ